MPVADAQSQDVAVIATDVVKVVGDSNAKPGTAAAGDANVKVISLVRDGQSIDFATQHYDPIPAPLGAKAFRLSIDLSLYSGIDGDKFFVMYGFDYSLDAGKSWLFGRMTTAGNNPVPKGFDPVSSAQTPLPQDQGSGVLILPKVGGKTPLDVGVKIEWL